MTVGMDDLLRDLIRSERLERSAKGMIYRAAKKPGDISVAAIAGQLAARNEGVSYQTALDIVRKAADAYFSKRRKGSR